MNFQLYWVDYALALVENKVAFYLNQPTEIDDTYPKYNPPNQSGKTSKIFGHVVWDNSADW